MAKAKNLKSAEEKFITSVRESLDDAESLLREAAEATGEKAEELRERAMRSLNRTRDHISDAQDALVEQGCRAARATDDYVHDNPWQAMAAAGLAGLVLGLLITRR
ncbi:MAG: DUF883 family protein [Castellaniella sp.]